MKNSLLWMVIAMIAITFTSCSNDNEESVNLAEQVAGQYKGFAYASFTYSSTPLTYTDENVTITSNNDGTVNLTFESGAWGTYSINNATAKLENGSYTFTGNGSVSITSHAGSSSYDFTSEVTLTSEKILIIDISLPSVMGGTTIKFTSGDAPDSWNLVGTYKGKTTATFKYSTTPMEYEDDVLTVTVNADDNTTLNINLENSTWGTYEVSNMEVTKVDGVYSFTGSGTVSMGMTEDSKKDYDFTVTGTVSDDKVMNVTFSIPSVMGGTTLTYVSSSVE